MLIASYGQMPHISNDQIIILERLTQSENDKMTTAIMFMKLHNPAGSNRI